jgi:hypothetical protein
VYDRGKILTGLIIFLFLILFPFIVQAGQPMTKAEPSLDTPEILVHEENKCIEPAETMRKEHMQILDEWRDAALREGKTVYLNREGIAFAISLQNTCLKCHSNQEKFCASCHTYSAEEPYCWECHISEKGAADENGS